MGDWGTVLDRLDLQASLLQGGNGAFPARAGPLDTHIHVLDTKLDRFFRRLLGGTLARERGTLAASLETTGSGACPAERITLVVGDRDNGVIKRRFHVCHGHGNVASLSLIHI